MLYGSSYKLVEMARGQVTYVLRSVTETDTVDTMPYRQTRTLLRAEKAPGKVARPYMISCGDRQTLSNLDKR